MEQTLEFLPSPVGSYSWSFDLRQEIEMDLDLDSMIAALDDFAQDERSKTPRPLVEAPDSIIFPVQPSNASTSASLETPENSMMAPVHRQYSGSWTSDSLQVQDVARQGSLAPFFPDYQWGGFTHVPHTHEHSLCFACMITLYSPVKQRERQASVRA